MRWLIIGFAVLIGLVAVVVLIGLLQPVGHTATTTATYAKPPADVWATIADFDRWPQWNPDVQSVEAMPDRNGHRMINITGSWGAAPTELAVWEPPTRLQTQMDAGSFRGSWTYELAPAADGGTVLTVTETGEVDNPLFRAMMIVMDKHATMVAFHNALAARLGVTVQPQKVAGDS